MKRAGLKLTSRISTCTWPPVCGPTIREVDRVFARENLAAGSALVAGSGIAGFIVVLQLRESDAGAHRVPGRMARKRAAKTLLPDAAGRGWRAIQSQAQNGSRPNVAARIRRQSNAGKGRAAPPGHRKRAHKPRSGRLSNHHCG